jgi:hypothetical protein
MQRGDTLRLQVPPARVAVFPAAEAA